jgi:hypothetical protein
MGIAEEEYGNIAALAGVLRGYVEGMKASSDDQPDTDRRAFCEYVGGSLRTLSERMRGRIDREGEDEGEDFETIGALGGFVVGLHAALQNLDEHPLTADVAHVLNVIGERFEMIAERLEATEDEDFNAPNPEGAS